MATVPKPKDARPTDASDIVGYYARLKEYIAIIGSRLRGIQDEEACPPVPRSQGLLADLFNVAIAIEPLQQLLHEIDNADPTGYARVQLIVHGLGEVDNKIKQLFDNLELFSLDERLKQKYPSKAEVVESILRTFGDHELVVKTVIRHQSLKDNKYSLTLVKDRLHGLDAEIDQTVRKIFDATLYYKRDEGLLIDTSDNSVHPGKILENYIIEHQWRVPYAAERLGVTREHMYAIMRGAVDISTSMARALERNQIGGTALDWLVLQAKYNLAQPERPPTPKRLPGRPPKP